MYGTNPTVADTDDDGLDDAAELAAGSDALKPDSDDDGLLDGAEVNQFQSESAARRHGPRRAARRLGGA